MTNHTLDGTTSGSRIRRAAAIRREPRWQRHRNRGLAFHRRTSRSADHSNFLVPVDVHQIAAHVGRLFRNYFHLDPFSSGSRLSRQLIGGARCATQKSRPHCKRAVFCLSMHCAGSTSFGSSAPTVQSWLLSVCCATKVQCSVPWVTSLAHR